MQPAQDLLTDRQSNEAYLAANPGQEYILYFPLGGTVGLDLTEHEGLIFAFNWVKLSTGKRGISGVLRGGAMPVLKTPGDTGWVATIVRVP